jgi:hypothetical protein
LAHELLNTAADKFDASTRKLIVVYRFEIEFILQSNGRVRQRFYDCWCTVAEKWMADTQAIEGITREVKHIGEIAPWIKWELLSSRTTARRAVSGYKADPGAKRAFLHTCVQCHSEAAEMLASDAASVGLLGRWDVVTGNSYPEAAVGNLELPLGRARDVCAATMLVAMKHAFVDSVDELGALAPSSRIALNMIITIPGSDGDAAVAQQYNWLISLSHSSVLWGVQAIQTTRQAHLSDSYDSLVHFYNAGLRTVLVVRHIELQYVCDLWGR